MLTDALRQLSRDPPKRNAFLLATLAILAVAFVSSGSASSSSSKATKLPSLSSESSSRPALLCNKDARASAATTKNPKKNMGLLGAPTSGGDPEESRHAALFAVAQLEANAAFPKAPGALSLARLVSAQRQVVAGTNHALVLETKDASGALKTVTATVYEKLPDHARNGARDMELTKFQVADGGAPAAEGAEEQGGGAAAADCAGAGAGSWQDEAARAAVAGINARSNSLVPYELAAVLEAKRGDGSASELKLELRRGAGGAPEGKRETFRVSVEERPPAGGVGASASPPGGGKRYGLVSFAHEP